MINKDLIKIIDINTLVISGGAMKGLLFVGCIKLLFELNMIKRFKYYYGTSIGALVITWLNLGWTLDEIIKFSTNFPINQLLINDIELLINNNCMTDSKTYIVILKKFITFKKFNENITFKELYEMTSKELNITTFSIKNNDIILLNHINTPNLKIWEGLFMSTSVPILFSPFNTNDDIYIDAGIMENFPLNRINPLNKSKTISMCICPYICQLDQMRNLIINKDIINYLSELFKIFISRKQIYIIDNYIRLNNNIASDMFNLNLDQIYKQKLINLGYEQTTTQLNDIIYNLYIEQLNQNKTKYSICKYSVYNEI